MQYSYLQKQQIVADLEAISSINSVVPFDGVKNLLTFEWPNGLPAAVVPTPTAKSATKVDSQHNDRVNEFTIFLVFDSTKLTTQYDVEQVVDDVMNAFDADQTLNGNSWPTVDAAVAATDALETPDASRQIIVVTIVLKAHTLIDVPLITT